MKFLGITAYAAALLTSIYALPGGHGHGNKHGWHHHKGKEHKEIHHKIYPAKTTTITEVIATKVETVVRTATPPPVRGIGGISPGIDTIPAECPLTPNTLFGEEVNHQITLLDYIYHLTQVLIDSYCTLLVSFMETSTL